MITMEAMREFFGWCSAINIGLLLLATIKLVLFRGPMSSLHGRMFNLDEQDISRAYLQFLAQYKIGILLLCIVPYVVLLIMS